MRILSYSREAVFQNTQLFSPYFCNKCNRIIAVTCSIHLYRPFCNFSRLKNHLFGHVLLLTFISKMCLCSRDPGELGVAGSSRSKNHAPGVRTMLQELGLGAAGRTRSTRSTRSPGSAYLVNIKELFFVIKNCPK